MPGDQELSIALVGDVRINRSEPLTAFQHVRGILREADFTFGNLEGAHADKGSLWLREGSNWKSGSSQLAAIKDAGFDAMNVANNHAMDFGSEAMLETIENLEKLGVGHTGGGRNAAEAYSPAIVEKKGCKVALLGYTAVYVQGWEAGPETPGIAVVRGFTAYRPPPKFFEGLGYPPVIHSWVLPEDKERMAKEIAAAKKMADVVICTFHWGVSGGFINLTEYQPDLAHHVIDSGADLVFGHHTHCLQGVEIYKGKPILYSLGNFAFDGRQRPGRHEMERALVRCRVVNKRIRSLDIFPALDDDKRIDGDKRIPRIVDLSEGRVVVSKIRERSAEFSTQFTEKNDALHIELPSS